MKKAVFIVFLVLLSFASLHAETVLFCISDNGDEEEKTPWTIAVMRAFEDGVMDEFFEAGHIVTNSFLNECKAISGKDAKNNSDVARIMGNRLGADSVMILELIFPEPVPDLLQVPTSADYALYTNTGKVIAAETSEDFNVAREIGEEELLDSFTELGKGIASGLAGQL